METLTIQLLNHKAFKLLKELEELHLIKMLENKNSSNSKLSDRFEGKLSDEAADALRNHVKQVREEWDRNI
jgi:hypothetical protein